MLSKTTNQTGPVDAYSLLLCMELPPVKKKSTATSDKKLVKNIKYLI
jgi:hypothetical protein